jgi:hypothetical protein
MSALRFMKSTPKLKCLTKSSDESGVQRTHGFFTG